MQHRTVSREGVKPGTNIRDQKLVLSGTDSPSSEVSRGVGVCPNSQKGSDGKFQYGKN